MRHLRQLVRGCIVTALAVATGCGIQADDQPRAIDDADLPVIREGASGTDAAGALRIYLVAPGDTRLLQSVSREAASREELIETLLLGPNEEELSAQWNTQIPPGTQLLSSGLSGTTMYLDLSSDLIELSSSAQPRALAQIVYTANEFTGVDAVQITIEGAQLPLPTGNGELTTGALRIYDYPGFVETAQPALPALPALPSNA